MNARPTPYLFRTVTCSLVAVACGLCSSVCHGQFETVINIPPDPAPSSIGSDTQLNLFDGGTLPSSAESPFQAGLPDGTSSNVEVNILGGTVGEDFMANAGSSVTVSDGTVRYGLSAGSGSVVEVSGGTLDGLRAREGSMVSISGGSVDIFTAFDGSEVAISGGVFGRHFRVDSESDVTLFGGEFLVNGVPPAEDPITITRVPQLLTGTLQDGSPFIFSHWSHSDRLDGVTLVSAPLSPLDRTPVVVSDDNAPSGLRGGQMLTVAEGGVLPENFAAVDATLNVDGGDVRQGLELAGSRMSISGGTVNGFAAYSGTEVVISGGTVQGFSAEDGSQVTISGGTMPHGFRAEGGSRVIVSGGNVHQLLSTDHGSAVTLEGGSVSAVSVRTDSTLDISGGAAGFLAASGTVSLSGGTVSSFNASEGSVANIAGGTTDSFSVTDGAVANISGGNFGFSFEVDSRGRMNVYGTEFTLDGVPVPELVLGEALEIESRDVELEGVFADGSPFSFQLNSTDVSGEDFISPDATLTLTSISALPGDYDSDGLVEQTDLDLVLSHWGEALLNPHAAGWINDLPSGFVDQEELDNVLANWGSSVSAVNSGSLGVPEPASCVLLLLAVAVLFARPLRVAGLSRRL